MNPIEMTRILVRRTYRASGGFVLLLVFVLVLQSLGLIEDPGESALRLNLLLQTCTLVAFCFWSVKTSGTYLNPPLVFTSCIFMWHSTFCLGHYFRLSPVFEYTGTAFSYGYDQIFKATALVGLSFGLAIAGVVLAYFRQRSKFETGKDPRSGYYRVTGIWAKYLAWVLLAVLSVFFLLYFITEGATLLRGEYMDMYYGASGSLIYLCFDRTKFLWPLVIILLASSYRLNRRVLIAVFVISVSLALLTAMLGARTEPFVILSALILAYDAFVRRMRIWTIGVFALGLTFASFVIENTRSTGVGLHVFSWSDTRLDQFTPWYLFAQNGEQIRAVLRTMEFSQGSPPQYGMSFVEAVVATVPKPILDLVDYEQPIQLSVWMATNSPDVGPFHGMGFSLVAEMYYNFRLFGCLGFFPIGWLLSSIYFKHVFYGDVFAGINALNVAAVLTLNMRNDAASYLRLLIYGFAFVALLKHERTVAIVQQVKQRHRILRQRELARLVRIP